MSRRLELVAVLVAVIVAERIARMRDGLRGVPTPRELLDASAAAPDANA